MWTTLVEEENTQMLNLKFCASSPLFLPSTLLPSFLCCLSSSVWNSYAFLQIPEITVLNRSTYVSGTEVVLDCYIILHLRWLVFYLHYCVVRFITGSGAVGRLSVLKCVFCMLEIN